MNPGASAGGRRLKCKIIGSGTVNGNGGSKKPDRKTGGVGLRGGAEVAAAEVAQERGGTTRAGRVGGVGVASGLHGVEPSSPEELREKLPHCRFPADDCVDFYRASVFECTRPFCRRRQKHYHPDLQSNWWQWIAYAPREVQESLSGVIRDTGDGTGRMLPGIGPRATSASFGRYGAQRGGVGGSVGLGSSVGGGSAKELRESSINAGESSVMERD